MQTFFLRVNSIGLVSLDHIRPMHDLYPGFIATHSELRKLSDNVLKHRMRHLDMRMDKFATYYYNDIYPKLLITDGVNIDESLLMDEVCEFIKKLELLIVHKSYNSSKNDNI